MRAPLLVSKRMPISRDAHTRCAGVARRWATSELTHHEFFRRRLAQGYGNGTSELYGQLLHDPGLVRDHVKPDILIAAVSGRTSTATCPSARRRRRAVHRQPADLRRDQPGRSRTPSAEQIPPARWSPRGPTRPCCAVAAAGRSASTDRRAIARVGTAIARSWASAAANAILAMPGPRMQAHRPVRRRHGPGRMRRGDGQFKRSHSASAWPRSSGPGSSTGSTTSFGRADQRPAPHRAGAQHGQRQCRHGGRPARPGGVGTVAGRFYQIMGSSTSHRPVSGGRGIVTRRSPATGDRSRCSSARTPG